MAKKQVTEFDYKRLFEETVMPAAFDRFKGLTQEQAHSELTETWKSEAEFKSNIKDAFSAFNKYTSPEDKGKINEIGKTLLLFVYWLIWVRILGKMRHQLRIQG